MIRSSRRWLLSFGLAIGVLALVTIVLVLITASPANDKPLLPEDTPEGTVQRFLLAIRDKDYLTAESYLSPPAPDDKNKMTPDLRQNQIYGTGEGPGWKTTLGKSTIRDNEATVDVTVSVFRPTNGPFGNSVNTYQVTFFLKKVATSWKITSPLNLWWLY